MDEMLIVWIENTLVLNEENVDMVFNIPHANASGIIRVSFVKNLCNFPNHILHTYFIIESVSL